MDQVLGRQPLALDAIIIPNRVPNVKRFFRVSELFGSSWMVSSFFLSTRTSKPPCLILYGLIIPLSEPNVKNFFRAGRIFLDVRHTRDLMRKSKGRTARNHSPTVHEPIIARPDHHVKKKVRSFSFFFGMDFSVSECIRIISLFFS